MNQLDAKSVVVGVNGSQAAVNAAKWAIDEALSRQMPLRLVYVITGKDTGSTQASDWELERAEMVLSQAESAVLSAAQAEGKPVEIETAIRSGDPARVGRGWAAGSHGRRAGDARALPGRGDPHQSRRLTHPGGGDRRRPQ